MKKALIILVVSALSPISAAQADTLFVDPNLSSSCSNYSTSSRSCSGGSDQGFSSFSSAINQAAPGDTIHLRGGNYRTLSINESGTPGNPIIIQAYDDETVTISGSDIGFRITDSSYVTLSGLTIDDAQGFGRLEDSSHITINDSTFRAARASGTTGGLKIVRSTFSTISNNTFTDGSDLMIIQDDSNNNLITGNAFSNASHSLISIRCSSENIIRNNRLGNSAQKAMEVYDCEGISDAPVRLDDTKRNLIEYNEFYLTAPSSAPHRYNAIQHSAQRTMVRFNRFYNNAGGAVRYQHYSDEALYTYENRLFHNTFYNNSCYAFSTETYISNQYYGHKVVNNAFFNNSDCSGGSSQISLGDSIAVTLVGNIDSGSPNFTNANAADFTPRAGSNLIDSGVHLTTTTSAGSGTTMNIADSFFFTDGFGINGEPGDTIKIASTGETAVVVSVDTSNHRLTLNRSLSWNNNDGVSLAYNGSGPDVGAIETGAAALADPNPPKNVRAVALED